MKKETICEAQHTDSVQVSAILDGLFSPLSEKFFLNPRYGKKSMPYHNTTFNESTVLTERKITSNDFEIYQTSDLLCVCKFK